VVSPEQPGNRNEARIASVSGSPNTSTTRTLDCGSNQARGVNVKPDSLHRANHWS
jgi:hypothetical protein